LIHPLLDRYYSFDNTDDQWKYYAVYISYGLWCTFIFFLIVMPLLNIPMSEFEKDFAGLGLFAVAGLTGVKSFFGSAKPAVVKSSKKEKIIALEEVNSGANLLD